MWLVLLMIVLFDAKTLYPQERIEKGANFVADTVPEVIQAKGRIIFALPGLNFTAQFDARVVGEDSAMIAFYGPMGVLLGKAMANKEYFEYYDVFNNWAVVGVPTREKIFEASQVPLNFTDIVRLFKGKILYDPDSLNNTKREEDKVLFSYKGSDFVDFFLVNRKNQVLQFQRKSYSDKVLLNILYAEYFEDGKENLPKKIIMQIEEQKGSVTMEIEKVIYDFDLARPFSFQIPKSVEVFRFE